MGTRSICQGIREGRITKPVVCWCIGTCAAMFASEVWAFLVKKTNLLWLLLLWLPLSSTCHCYLQVQFGHAGACANQASETAVAKNQALRDAGAYVPKSFDELGDVVK